MVEDAINCPFCNSDSVSIQSHTTETRYNEQGYPLYYQTFSARCNKCRARGPTVSGWVNDWFGNDRQPTVPWSEHSQHYEAEALRLWNGA